MGIHRAFVHPVHDPKIRAHVVRHQSPRILLPRRDQLIAQPDPASQTKLLPSRAEFVAYTHRHLLPFTLSASDAKIQLLRLRYACLSGFRSAEEALDECDEVVAQLLLPADLRRDVSHLRVEAIA